MYKDAPVGQRFGRWTVTGYAGTGTQRYQHRWLVRCDCGREHERRADSVVSGRSTQCTVCNAEDQAAARTLPTGSANHRAEYKVWRGMLARCDDRENKWFARYGGRGIRVCERWRSDFVAFYSDVGPRPGRGYSIDRIDNDGDYEPGNVRWATMKTQSRNTRRNHVIEIDGRAQCIAAWAEELGIRPQIISTRLRRGWSEREAVLGSASLGSMQSTAAHAEKAENTGDRERRKGRGSDVE